MAISKKTWTGFAREAVSGTAIATPTKFCATKSTMKNKKKVVKLDEERGTRDDIFGLVNTTRWSEWDFKGSFYPDVHGYLLLAALGTDTVTQPDSTNAPNAYKHTFSLADTPPSLTLFKSYDSKTYYSPYGVVEKFSIKVVADGKLVDFEANAKALAAQLVATPPVPTYSTVNPFIGYAPTITLGGVQTTDIDDLTLNFTQKVGLWQPASGSPDWLRADFGGREMSLDFTARFDTDTLYQRYLNGTTDTLTLDIKGDLIGGAIYNEFSISCGYVHYEDMEHDTGKENVLVKAKATIFNGGSNGLITSCYLTNTVPNYTV